MMKIIDKIKTFLLQFSKRQHPVCCFCGEKLHPHESLFWECGDLDETYDYKTHGYFLGNCENEKCPIYSQSHSLRVNQKTNQFDLESVYLSLYNKYDDKFLWDLEDRSITHYKNDVKKSVIPYCGFDGVMARDTMNVIKVLEDYLEAVKKDE